MVELVYPPERAAVIGHNGGASEMLPIVEPNGVVVAQAARSICHYSGQKLLHPVVHLHVVDRMGRIYLQKRSGSKRRFPHLWDTSVGGHVSYGEFISEALYREASEEIGLRDFNPVFICSYVYECERERELVNVYAAVGNFELKPDGVELEDGRFWTDEEIEENSGKGIFTPNFESEYRDIKDKLISLL